MKIVEEIKETHFVPNNYFFKKTVPFTRYVNICGSVKEAISLDDILYKEPTRCNFGSVVY